MANDMAIIFSIVTLFIALGFITPYINSEFDSDFNTNNPDNIIEGISSDDLDNGVSGWKILKTVFSMFFWSFGELPAWLDIIVFIPLRLLLALTIARNVWIGGGG